MNRQETWRPDDHCTHVHIVCGTSIAGSMKVALAKEDPSGSHKLIVLTENYAIGPVQHLDSAAGRAARSEWFRNHIAGCANEREPAEEQYTELLDDIARIPEQARIIIWADDNACEQMGLRHALYLLRSLPQQIAVYNPCAICEQLYNSEDAAQHYHHSGEIPSAKLQQVLQMTGNDTHYLDAGQRGQLSAEWQTLTQQNGVLRIWNNHQVQEVPVDYHDAYLLDKLDKLRPPTSGNNDFLIAARLIAEAMAYNEQFTGDAFWEYRLRELVYNGVLEIKGVPGGPVGYSIRRNRELPIDA
ncbi:DUF1835 domain-containing protein [Paenibacillus wulumuqiensis]|uniref:DUF1835 domain-containing protein n=1 Tax=Paenibacillus wulumuqiensis TaxID=1567107 RepID=UPI000698F41A|nr:DUF1835 domain-containing protein [Paenibacillus wulumuqiensis]